MIRCKICRRAKMYVCTKNIVCRLYFELSVYMYENARIHDLVVRSQTCANACKRELVARLYTCENPRRHELVLSLYSCKIHAYVAYLMRRRAKMHVFVTLEKSVDVQICSQTCFTTFVDVQKSTYSSRKIILQTCKNTRIRTGSLQTC